MASLNGDDERCDEFPLDFLNYLERRLGADTKEALHLLGAWLKSYQPAQLPSLPVDRGRALTTGR